MSKRQKCVLNLRFTIKQGFMDSMMNELRIILDQCALEEDFVAAVLHQSPDRPNDIMLYEIWHGTKEEFAKTQGQKPYRQEYMKNSKQYVESVRIEWDIPTIEWGTANLLDG
jgi:quinol monooxygenase YgiN